MNNLLGFAAGRKNSLMTTIAGWLADGAIEFYTTPRPANADTAITTQTLLATFPLASPAGTVTGNTFTGAALAPALILESGNAVWARIKDSVDATVFDGDIGTTGSGAMIELDSAGLLAGGYCAISSFSLTVP